MFEEFIAVVVVNESTFGTDVPAVLSVFVVDIVVTSREDKEGVVAVVLVVLDGVVLDNGNVAVVAVVDGVAVFVVIVVAVV